MFQVAYAHVLARRFGGTPRFVDLSGQARVARRWELECFGIHPYPCAKGTIIWLVWRVLVTRKLRELGIPVSPRVHIELEKCLDRTVPHRAPSIVSGYWQGIRYMELEKAQVRKLFQFPAVPRRFVFTETSNDSVAAIHVRLGDYKTDRIARELHFVCGAEYYHTAWNELRARTGVRKAIVFSDDPPEALRMLDLEGDVSIVHGDSHAEAWIDMARMSRCDHFIISNSSFSWWAAYLATSPRKVVVAPRFWFRNQETASLGICPTSWRLV